MRIFITGGAGLLAQGIKQQAPDFHIEVLAAPAALTRSVTEHHGWDELDVLNSTFLPAMHQLKPDCIIHSAAMVNTDKCLANPKRCVDVNLHGTRHVLEACQRLKIPILYLSTTATYEPNQRLPLVETSLQQPRTLYGITKLAGELLVIGQSITPWLVLRPCFIFGDPPRDHSSQLCRVVVHALLKQHLPKLAGPVPRVTLDPAKRKDYMRVEDFSRAVLMVLSKFFPFQHPRIFNVAAEQARPVAEYFQGTGLPLELEWAPEEDYLGNHLVSAEELRASTGWSPRLTAADGTKLLVEAARRFISVVQASGERVYYR